MRSSQSFCPYNQKCVLSSQMRRFSFLRSTKSGKYPILSSVVVMYSRCATNINIFSIYVIPIYLRVITFINIYYLRPFFDTSILISGLFLLTIVFFYIPFYILVNSSSAARLMTSHCNHLRSQAHYTIIFGIVYVALSLNFILFIYLILSYL